jgi:hypothetical protein
MVLQQRRAAAQAAVSTERSCCCCGCAGHVMQPLLRVLELQL